MKPLVTKQTDNTEAFLSVSYKAAETWPTGVRVEDSVIVTDVRFCITGFNKEAATLFGLTERHLASAILQDAINFKFKNGAAHKILFALFRTGSWGGEVIYTNAAGQQFHFYSTATLINNNSLNG